MTRIVLSLSVALMAASCEDKAAPEPKSKPVSEVSSKKVPPNSMVKKNTGVYSGQVIKKLQSADPYLRLSMGDYKLVISDSAANGREISHYLEKIISVKGDMDGDEFIVSEWLD